MISANVLGKSLFIACNSGVAGLSEFHFRCGIQFLGFTSITSSIFNSLVVAMYVTSDDSGLAKPTTSPLARCKVFTWSRFVIANNGNLPEFSSDIIAISC